MITGRTHAELMQVRDTMRDVLSNAMDQRDQRRDLVADGLFTVPAWVHYEREQMTNAVNAARISRDLPKLTVEDVARVEQQASGHSDYFAKYAFYCAELALGLEPRFP